MKFEEFIADKQEIKIGYIGGSITEGSGASSRDKRYSSLFTAALNKRFTNKSFVEINAGIGGTPSALGLFRLKQQVLDFNPDILFIEFAVNDSGSGESMFKYTEGIVRRALSWNPKLPIVFLFTYPANEFTVEGHKKICREYGLPYVDMNSDLKEKIAHYGGDDRFFTRDGVHPNDLGYASYVDSMMRELGKFEFEFKFPQEPIYGVEFTNPRIIPAAELCAQGWQLSERSMGNIPLKYIFADKPGTQLTIEFEGRTCGLYLRMEKDGCYASVTVDGKPSGTAAFWDKYSLQFDRDNYSMLADALPLGKHTVTITINEEKAEQSEGHVARIGGILVG